MAIFTVQGEWADKIPAKAAKAMTVASTI